MLAWIIAPFAPVIGPIAGANVLLLLAMPISATAAFVVLRKWDVWIAAAALGGLVYGFSPYMVAQGIAHLGLVFVPVPPFIALTIVSIVQGKGSTARLGVQLGLLVVAQYLISPEVLASVAVLAVVGLACVALRAPAAVPELAREAAGAAGVALFLASALLAYPLWFGFLGPQHFSGPPTATTNPYHADLLGTLVPTPLQRDSLGLRALGIRLTASGGLAEADAYIGAPVLVVSVVLAWWSRRSPRMQLAALLTVVAAVLSLGPHLAVDGHLTSIPMPFLVLDHLPLLNLLLPSRIGLEMDACLAAVVAFGLDDMRRRTEPSWNGRRGSAACAAVALAALVVTQLPAWPDTGPEVPVRTIPAAVIRGIPAGDPVALTYPYDIGAGPAGRWYQPMLWQVEDGFEFRQLAGYAYHALPGGQPSLLPTPMSPPETQQFLADQEGVDYYGPGMAVSPKLVVVTRSVLAEEHVRVVIVDRSTPGSGAVVELFDDVIGRPRRSAGQFSLWVDGRAVPSQQQYSHHLSTTVILPTTATKVSGHELLGARANGYYPVTRVVFVLSGEGRRDEPVAQGKPSLFGWLAVWRATAVPDGTYTLQSKASDKYGGTSLSTPVTITVNHTTNTTAPPP